MLMRVRMQMLTSVIYIMFYMSLILLGNCADEDIDVDRSVLGITLYYKIYYTCLIYYVNN